MILSPSHIELLQRVSAELKVLRTALSPFSIQLMFLRNTKDTSEFATLYANYLAQSGKSIDEDVETIMQMSVVPNEIKINNTPQITKPNSAITEIALGVQGLFLDTTNLFGMFFFDTTVERSKGVSASLYSQLISKIAQNKTVQIFQKILIEPVALARLAICDLAINKPIFLVSGRELLPAAPKWLKKTKTFALLDKSLKFIGNIPIPFSRIKLKDIATTLKEIHQKYVSKLLFSVQTRKILMITAAAIALTLAVGAPPLAVGFAAYVFTAAVIKTGWSAYLLHKSNQDKLQLSQEHAMLSKYIANKKTINQVLQQHPSIKKALGLKQKDTVSNIHTQFNELLKQNPAITQILNIKADMKFKDNKKQVIFVQTLKAMVQKKEISKESFIREYSEKFKKYHNYRYHQKKEVSYLSTSGAEFYRQSIPLLLSLGVSLQTGDFLSVGTVSTDLGLLLTGGFSSSFVDQLDKNKIQTEVARLRMDGPDYEIKVDRYGREIEGLSKYDLNQLVFKQEVQKLALEKLVEQVIINPQENIIDLYAKATIQASKDILKEQKDLFNEDAFKAPSLTKKITQTISSIFGAISPFAQIVQYPAIAKLEPEIIDPTLKIIINQIDEVEQQCNQQIHQEEKKPATPSKSHELEVSHKHGVELHKKGVKHHTRTHNGKVHHHASRRKHLAIDQSAELTRN